MNAKKIHLMFISVVVLAAVVILLMMAPRSNSSWSSEATPPPAAQGSPSSSSTPLQNSTPAGGIRVEVIHFHATHQCYSCITVGDYAAETVNTYFPRELAEGKLSFAHVNAELPENRALVEQYEVTSASLWIGVYDATGFHKEENTRVWYKISDKADYMSYLKGIIEKRLNGDFSG